VRARHCGVCRGVCIQRMPYDMCVAHGFIMSPRPSIIRCGDACVLALRHLFMMGHCCCCCCCFVWRALVLVPFGLPLHFRADDVGGVWFEQVSKAAMAATAKVDTMHAEWQTVDARFKSMAHMTEVVRAAAVEAARTEAIALVEATAQVP